MGVFIASQFQEISSTVKIISGLISFLLFILIIFLLTRSEFLKLLFWQDIVEFLGSRAYGAKKFVKKWNKIKRKLELPSEAEHKLAIIEAEGLLDEILRKMGFGGETIGDRLKQLTPVQLQNLEEVWEAHKIRNNIVHDPDYRLSPEEARKAFEIYERALTNLEAF